jgi:hypothetical protein
VFDQEEGLRPAAKIDGPRFKHAGESRVVEPKQRLCVQSDPPRFVYRQSLSRQ